ncbi:hypothetical protein ACF08M_36835 [Streptomyces sp. NPDC015032]|uniref:hypothetical protein n=1 Tax=Streptomyces sp. NPDC015032 TaxID=3364937 RepID=UPI0036FA9C60
MTAGGDGDPDGEIHAVLRQLATVAGLDHLPRVIVDPAAVSGGAVVFGSNRRPAIRLHGGLIVRRHTDPERFRAGVLHEYAHIRNGDIRRPAGAKLTTRHGTTP